MSGDQEKGCGCLLVIGIVTIIDWIMDPESIIYNILGGIAIIVIILIGCVVVKGIEGIFNQSLDNSSSTTQTTYTPPTREEPANPQTTIIQPISSQIKRPAHPQVTVCKSPTLSNDWLATRLAITKNLSPVKKINHDSFRRELLGHGITCFYHFTDVRNLENIRKYGGLISWSSCDSHEVEIPSAGGSDFSRRLDMRYNLQDYVRLSFCDDHPMAYRLKQEGKTLVLLKIKIDVATWEDTLFSNINATDVGHSHGGTLSDLQKIKWGAVKRNYVSRDDEDFKYHQAEILVKTAIPKEFIVNLDNPIYL